MMAVVAAIPAVAVAVAVAAKAEMVVVLVVVILCSFFLRLLHSFPCFFLRAFVRNYY